MFPLGEKKTNEAPADYVWGVKYKRDIKFDINEGTNNLGWAQLLCYKRRGFGFN